MDRAPELVRWHRVAIDLIIIELYIISNLNTQYSKIYTQLLESTEIEKEFMNESRHFWLFVISRRVYWLLLPKNMNIYMKICNYRWQRPYHVEYTGSRPNSVKYLGVCLDKRMSFMDNTKNLTNKAHKTIRVLYPLLNRNSKLSISTKRLLYTAIIRPIITYASPVWCSMSKTSMTKIQRLQNKCLRLVLNKEWYTTINELHELTGIERIETFIKRLSINFYTNQIKNSDLTKNMILDRNALNSLPMTKHKFIYSKINFNLP